VFFNCHFPGSFYFLEIFEKIRYDKKAMKPHKTKLSIELVPRTSWHKSLRKLLPQSIWKKIQKEIFEKYGNKCAICGTKRNLNCHEVWKYDDKRHIQKLIDFIPLCKKCHFVKHLGFATVLAARGELDFNKIIRHFMKVNNCDKKIFEKHKKKAFSIWHERSRYR
jgi:predicted flavoprotein YhiN